MPKQSLYKILELNNGASIAEVKKAYRKLSLKYHPDTNRGKKSSVDKFIQIDNAYNILSDPIKKAEYDRSIKNAQQQEPLSNKRHKTQTEGRRTYETERTETESIRDWRSTIFQIPIIRSIFLYLGFAILIIFILLPSNEKKNYSNNSISRNTHYQYTDNRQNEVKEEKQLATLNDIINDKEKKEYESIDYPLVIDNYTPHLWLYNVELTGSETILSFMYNNLSNNPATISDNIRLIVRTPNNSPSIVKEYKLLRVENTPIASLKKVYSESDNLFFFQLIFDAVPNFFRHYNLVERKHHDKNPFISLGIDLNNEDIHTRNKFEEMKSK